MFPALLLANHNQNLKLFDRYGTYVLPFQQIAEYQVSMKSFQKLRFLVAQLYTPSTIALASRYSLPVFSTFNNLPLPYFKPHQANSKPT